MGERAGKMLVGPGRPYDLIAVCLLAAGAALLSFYSRSGPLTWTLGFLAVFFAPGYAIVSALFPGNRELLAQSFVTRREERVFMISLLERITLSFGMSAVAVALAATFLARVLSSLNVILAALTVVGLTGLISAVAVYRRSGLPPGDQFAIFTRGRAQGSRRGFSRAEKGASALIAVALVVLAGVAVNGMTARPPSGDQFTEFSISGADGNLQQLPQQLAPGQGGTVRVTVISHLSEAENMRLTVALWSGANDGAPFLALGMAGPLNEARTTTFDVGAGDQWSQLVTFTIPVAGTYTVYFTLDDGHEVKALWMPITVTGGNATAGGTG